MLLAEAVMTATLGFRAKQILEGPVLAHFATIMRDGSPQVTPVWVDHDGDYVLVNSEAHRLKVKNVRRDPRVALSVLDATNSQGRLIIRGRVIQIITEGAIEHIQKLARKYTEYDYPITPGETRVILKIEPLNVSVSNRWA
jgi:PPOX class probable F420-dependent enzyme